MTICLLWGLEVGLHWNVLPTRQKFIIMFLKKTERFNHVCEYVHNWWFVCERQPDWFGNSCSVKCRFEQDALVTPRITTERQHHSESQHGNQYSAHCIRSAVLLQLINSVTSVRLSCTSRCLHVWLSWVVNMAYRVFLERIWYDQQVSASTSGVCHLSLQKVTLFVVSVITAWTIKWQLDLTSGE